MWSIFFHSNHIAIRFTYLDVENGVKKIYSQGGDNPTTVDQDQTLGDS